MNADLTQWVLPPVTQICVKLLSGPWGLPAWRLCSHHHGPTTRWRNGTHKEKLRSALEDHLTYVHIFFVGHHQAVYPVWSPHFHRQCFWSLWSAAGCHNLRKSPYHGTYFYTIWLGHTNSREHTEEMGVWRDSLQDLKQLKVPGTYISEPLTSAVHTELCAFFDALIRAIGAVA